MREVAIVVLAIVTALVIGHVLLLLMAQVHLWLS